MTDPGDDYRLLTEEYMRFFRTEDLAPLDAVLATVLTSTWEGDPLWLYVVGPPSSGKTEILRCFDGLPSTYFLSSLTPNSLISGLKDGKHLLPELNQKTLVIKDFTMTLESDRFARDALFGALRDAYDGSFSKAFGTVGTKRFDSHFNLVAAVTSAIEDYYTVQAVLGQRFLVVRTSFPDDFDADDRRDIEKIRGRLRELAEAVLRNRTALPDKPPIADERVVACKVLARDVALLRTHVHRDGYTHDIGSLPEPEAPARLTNQFIKLARGLAAIHAKSDVTEEEMALVRRVARDTVPRIRLQILEAVHGGAATIDAIASTTRLSRRTVERKVEDLTVLGVLAEDASSKPYVYSPARGLSFLPPTAAHVRAMPDVGTLEKARTHIRMKAAADPGRPPSFLARDAILALQLPEDVVPELEAFAEETRQEEGRG